MAKTLEGAAGLLRDAVFAEEVADRHGLLQRIDVRAKLLGLGTLVLTASLAHRPVTLLALYTLTLALAAASALPIGGFIKRVWLFVPIFTGIVVLPATLSFITPGTILVPLGSWFGHPVGITQQGLTSATLIVLRVATSTSLVILLTLTTRWTDLLASLRTLRVPLMFVQVLGLAHRYLFHLLGSVTEMFTARRSRSVTSERDTAAGRAFVASSAGALFGKAHGLAEEVHQAMVSRGYVGEIHSVAPVRLSARDAGWILLAVAIAAVVLLGDRSVGW